MAGTLLKLAEDPRYGGPVTVSKPDFARALADRMLADLSETADNEQADEALRRSRPLLAFVLDRVLPVLTGPRWQWVIRLPRIPAPEVLAAGVRE